MVLKTVEYIYPHSPTLTVTSFYISLENITFLHALTLNVANKHKLLTQISCLSLHILHVKLGMSETQLLSLFYHLWCKLLA